MKRIRIAILEWQVRNLWTLYWDVVVKQSDEFRENRNYESFNSYQSQLSSIKQKVVEKELKIYELKGKK
jgi:hypothetical protein